MSDHADLLAAIDKARPVMLTPTAAEERLNAHLDTLRAILDLHHPHPVHRDYCQVCGFGGWGWPCPSVQVVAYALTRIGAL